ncbi:hypothetical protein KKF34_01535 [Myxococcota bacterium]|nr:hypothetical protein [Myxococcota bacterium]MBU1380082.1 hypothetical protein [Myxococcota bacterium]MBU1495540.1 hypothetical protein [Myxococcota bacterium]
MMAFFRYFLFLFVCYFNLACSNNSSHNSAPVPGSTGIWISDYTSSSASIDCSMTYDELAESSAARVTVDTTSLFVGYIQKDNNQNPLLIRMDDSRQIYCIEHETQSPDGRAEAITWDGGEYAYIVYTMTGGGTDLEMSNGWLSSYSAGLYSGGGPKVSVIGRVKPFDGVLSNSTFIIAVKSDNKVNSHAPSAAVDVDSTGNVIFYGESAHKPIDTDKKPMDCTDYPFDSTYIFSEDLSTLICAQCTNCTLKNPCNL